MHKFVFAAAAATLAVLGTAGAHAVTSVSSVNGPDGAGQTVIFDFESGMPAGLSGNAGIRIGTVAGQYAAPLGDTTHFLVVPVDGSSGTALLNLGASYGNISFYWGSIDTYNTVEFFTGANGSGASLGAYAGNNIPLAMANGDQGNILNNRRVFFNFGGDLAQSVRFTSTSIAFEIDNIATAAVPEPAVWGTMLVGFGFVGVTLRRRRTISVTA